MNTFQVSKYIRIQAKFVERLYLSLWLKIFLCCSKKESWSYTYCTLNLFVVGSLLYENGEESFLFDSVTKYICRAEYMRVIFFLL
jgi:hypothetical protein